MAAYNFPPVGLLDDSPVTGKYMNPECAAKKKKDLQDLFDLMEMDVKVVDCRSSTVDLLLQIRLGEKVTSKAVRDRKKDIELRMEDSVEFREDDTNDRIMYIVIRDMSRPVVALKEVIHSSAFLESPSRLAVAAGIDFFGGKLIIDLEEIGNLLVVGVTGSGKSVFLGDVITSILFRARPDEVQFLFFDFKGVELPLFNEIPHLITPSVKSRERAMKGLAWLEETANKRQFLLATHHKGSFEEYNASVENKLPRIVLIIDEYMSLMDRRGKTDPEFTRMIRNIANTTRQTGIHLILSTQRPSAKIISKEISEAIPHRVSFYVMSGADSKIAINRTGAQRLLGEGDMIYADIRSEKGTHAQAALITDAEIDRVIRFCQEQIGFGAEELQDE